jgi:hypothetical protein
MSHSTLLAHLCSIIVSLLYQQSLQNLFDTRVQVMKEKAKDIQSASMREVSDYK